MSEQRHPPKPPPRPAYPMYAYPTPYQPYYYHYYPPVYPNTWHPPPYYTVPPPPPQRQQQPRRPRHQRVRREEDEDRGRRRAPVKKEEDRGVELENVATKVVESADEAEMKALAKTWLDKVENETDFKLLLDGCNAIEILMTGMLKTEVDDTELISLLSLVLWGGEGCMRRICELIRGLNSALSLVSGAVRERWMTERMSAISKVVAFLRAVRREVDAVERGLPELGGGGIGAWRRGMGKVQGLGVVMAGLRKAVEGVSGLRFEVEGSFLELDGFYGGVREVVVGGLRGELRRRGEEVERLKEVVGGGCGVFEGVVERAERWIGELEAVRREVEGKMDESGIGFGGVKVAEGGVNGLLTVCGGVARLVAVQQKAFLWVDETGEILGCMVSAWGAVGGALKGVEECFEALEKVADWKWGGVERVVGCVEKSLERNVRFEEPPKTPKEGRRVRHARMKSSPDALLHLNVEGEKEVLPVVYELEEEEEEEEKATPSHVRSMSVDGIPF